MPTKYWIAVVSKEHVQNGMDQAIIQVCHGKKAPLKRIRKGDYVVFYSSKIKRTDKTPYQHFTAIARMPDDILYQVTMFENFMPFRRRAEFLPCKEISIRPLINDLEFIKNKKSWGYVFRFGLLEIPREDFVRIATEMECSYG